MYYKHLQRNQNLTLRLIQVYSRQLCLSKNQFEYAQSNLGRSAPIQSVSILPVAYNLVRQRPKTRRSKLHRMHEKMMCFLQIQNPYQHQPFHRMRSREENLKDTTSYRRC